MRVRHLGCMNVLAYARILCGPVCMRYRSSEIICMYTDTNVLCDFLSVYHFTTSPASTRHHASLIGEKSFMQKRIIIN